MCEGARKTNEAITTHGRTSLPYLIVLAMLRPFGYDERRLINSLLPRPVFIW